MFVVCLTLSDIYLIHILDKLLYIYIYINLKGKFYKEKNVIWDEGGKHRLSLNKAGILDRTDIFFNYNRHTNEVLILSNLTFVLMFAWLRIYKSPHNQIISSMEIGFTGRYKS